MKKIFTAISATALFTIFTVSYASSQGTALNPNMQSNTPKDEVVSSTNEIFEPSMNVNPKAKRDFEQTFQNDIKPNWYSRKDGGFTATFINGKIHGYIHYSKKGIWQSSFKSVDESQMNKEVRSLIKPVYYDYKINRVTEISIPDYTVYFVYLQDATSFKTIKICNDEMELVEWIENGKMVKL